MKKMIKTITKIMASAGAVLALCSGNMVLALSAREGAEAARADEMPTELIGDTGVFTRISNTILLIIGLISVIMLIYGGLRYILSGGDNKKVTDAKNTILYAIIGLIVALLAYAIVNFVITAITGGAAPAGGAETTESVMVLVGR